MTDALDSIVCDLLAGRVFDLGTVQHEARRILQKVEKAHSDTESGPVRKRRRPAKTA